MTQQIDSPLDAAPANTSADWRRVPGSRRMFIAADSGRAARRLRSLSGSSDWRRGALDRVGMAAVAVLGPAPLPVASPLHWPAVSYGELGEALRSKLPGLRPVGLVAPRQPGRRRLSLLARMTGNPVVVKLGDGDDQLEREAAALELLAAHPIPGIATPIPIALGAMTCAGSTVTYLATTAISLGRQRPAIDAPLRTFERDLASRLSSLPRPLAASSAGDRAADSGSNGETGELVPVHGDLTPWNLRRTSHGLALFDWESVGWGPPGSDLATYRTACDSVRPWWSRRGATHQLTSPVVPARDAGV
jgi:hypothetical protein